LPWTLYCVRLRRKQSADGLARGARAERRSLLRCIPHRRKILPLSWDTAPIRRSTTVLRNDLLVLLVLERGGLSNGPVAKSGWSWISNPAHSKPVVCGRTRNCGRETGGAGPETPTHKCWVLPGSMHEFDGDRAILNRHEARDGLTSSEHWRWQASYHSQPRSRAKRRRQRFSPRTRRGGQAVKSCTKICLAPLP